MFTWQSHALSMQVFLLFSTSQYLVTVCCSNASKFFSWSQGTRGGAYLLYVLFNPLWCNLFTVLVCKQVLY
jgi:hypothetical protein